VYVLYRLVGGFKGAEAGGLDANLTELAIKVIEGFCEDGRKGGFG
jgi:hypothetical protein